MKNAILSLVVFIIVLQVSFGQCLINPNHTTPLFFPDSSQIPCIEQGVPYNFDLQLRAYDSLFGGEIFEWMRIDSVVNLPSGINWNMNVPIGNSANTLNANENGCINFSGVTNSFRNIYDAKIYSCIKVSVSPTPICGELEEFENFMAELYGIGGTLSNYNKIKFNVISVGGICAAGTGSGAIINGKVYYDENNNGVFDGNDVPFTNSAISISPVPFTVYTNSNGDYSLFTTAQDVSLTIIPPTYFSPSSNATLNFNNIQQGQIISSADFGLLADTVIHEVSVSLTQSAVRPGFTTTIWVDLQNNGTQFESGSIKLTYDNVLTYLSSSTPFSDHALNELTFDFTNFAPGTQRQIRVEFQVPADVNLLGSTIVSYVTVTTINVEQNEENNYATVEQVVTGAYDPNDKNYSPFEDIFKNGVALGDYINYTIRFQNTGTDTAFTVIICDTLDKNVFDISSFEPISSSHIYKLQLNSNGELAWTFNNILLPDSGVNEPGSHGYVKFRIAIKNNLADRTTINNTAAIYFDFNPPIITNTSTTKVNIYLSVNDFDYKKDQLKIYPHPVVQHSVIAFENFYENVQLEVFDLTGKIIFTEKYIQTDKIIFSRKGISNGLFFYNIKADKNQFKGKIFVD